MQFWHSLAGGFQVELKCADPAFALSQLQERGIILYQAQLVDDFTVSFTVSRFQIKAIKKIAEKRGFSLHIQGRQGIYWLIPGLLRRPVLVLGLSFLLILGMYLPTRVLFIQVEGNTTIPTRMILEAAASCGIDFGASRAEVRSEKMKNALLQCLPQLQWAGINTSGCTAVISVKERQLTNTQSSNNGVASIVAIRDGIIASVTATKGNALCKIGQAVKAGETLISGYTDCGFTIQASRAEGEVYGTTERELELVTPMLYESRSETTDAQEKYSLIIGKKRINLYFGSGISDVSCVKMYVEKYLTLPGGFQLPIALVTEVWTTTVSQPVEAEVNASILAEAAQQYIHGDMTAGQILTADIDVARENGVSVLYGRYACLEMIGQLREEEIVKPNGTND